MTSLVGYTGFVGSNIQCKGTIDCAYNSKNIEEAYGTNPDLLIYAGLSAEKYLANSAPEKDLEKIMQAQRNIEKINSQKLVLISTIDVFKNPVGVNENSRIDTDDLHAYGYNRYLLECWVRDHYPDALIIRLPGLFGINIKKNFIFDYINVIPSMLKCDKFYELLCQDTELERYYRREGDYYRVIELGNEREALKEKFKNLGFSALNFTDSRSIYQFYNLGRLWKDIQIALRENLLLWHPATEPIFVSELYSFLSGGIFENAISAKPAHYDYRSMYAELFGGAGGYIEDKQTVMSEIRDFVEMMQRKEQENG